MAARLQQRRTTALVITLWVVVGGLIGMYLTLFAVCAAGRVVRSQDEFTYGESWLLDGARQVAAGKGLYGAPDQIPLMHFAYTPLYYAVVGGLLRITGDYGYTVGRLVSLGAMMAGALAIAWTLTRLTGRRRFGVLGACVFLTQNLTALLWASLHRVDPLALGLTLVGLALATAGRHSLAAVLFLLALFTKQTFFVAPLVVAISLWPCRRQLVRYLAILAVGGGSLLGAADLLTHGWFLWHTVRANNNQMDLITFSVLMGSFLQFNGLMLLATLGCLTLPSLPGERLWRIYFAGCLLTLPSVAKLGASSNYWLELSAAMAVLVAVAAYRLSSLSMARLVAPVGIAGALLIAVPAYQSTAVEASTNVADLLKRPQIRYLSLVADGDTATPMRVDAAFVDQLADEPGDLLTDNAGLAVAARKPIMFEFQIFQLLGAGGGWSEQPIVDAVADRRFALVALMHPLDGPIDGTRWTPAVRDALTSAYAPAGQQAGFWLYRPRP